MREISEIHFATGAGTDVRELVEQYCGPTSRADGTVVSSRERIS
jgi:hypothetical protein